MQGSRGQHCKLHVPAAAQHKSLTWLATLQADELVQRVRAAKQYGKQVRHHAGSKVSIQAVDTDKTHTSSLCLYPYGSG